MKKLALVLAIAAASVGFADAASFSGGRAIGARSTISAPRAPTPTAPTVSAPYSAPAPAASTGGSALGTFAAAAGGAAVGSVVGNALSGGHESTTVINSAPAPVVSAPVAQAAAPIVPSPVVYQAPAPVSTWRWFGQTLGLLAWLALLGGAAYGAYRLYSWSKRKREIDVGGFSPAVFFLDVQHELAVGDLEKLRVKLTPEMLKMAEGLIRGGTYVCGIERVSYECIHNDGLMMEIRYQAEDRLDGEKIDEIWMLKWINGHWMLAGITPTV